MSKPPPEENRPDQLIEAYRRASANDASRPSEPVRASILAQSKHIAASQSNAAARSLAPTAPAANESRWKWKLAASLAALGIAGLLAVQTLITVPRGAAPTRPDTTAESAPRIALVAPAAAPSDSAAVPAPPPPAVARTGARDQIRARAGSEANAPQPIAPTPPMPAAVPETRLAAAAPSGADASRQDALTARVQSPANLMAARAGTFVASARRDQAITALQATFPELFAAPAIADTVRIAMVLNSDGTPYKIAREQPAAAGQADAALQLSQALGVGPDELEAPAQFMTLARTAAQPNTIVVALGVRKMQLGPSRDAR